MIIGNKIILREKRLSGAWDDYTWETDPELAYLDAATTTTAAFSQYLTEYFADLNYLSPTSHCLAIYTLDGIHIGNCSYYNINQLKRDAEVGIMLGNREYWNKGFGTDVMTTLVNHLFRQVNLKRLYLKTLSSNIRAQKCFQKSGFTPYGQMSRNSYSFMLMEIYRSEWRKQQTEIACSTSLKKTT